MEEDGEIFEVDAEENQQSDFSMSSYDGENGDSLDIKPPQAQVVAMKEKREKRTKRSHRHKEDGGSSHRHKSDRHRSRSDHRQPGEHHSRDKRRHREGDRSESSSRRHRRQGTEAAAAGGGGGDHSMPRPAKEGKDRSRSGKRGEPREHRRGRDRTSSNNQHIEAGDYYSAPGDDHHHQPPLLHHHHRQSGPPLLPDPVHMFPHHQQQQPFHHSHHNRGGSSSSVQDLSLLQLSPRARAEREKRMERMMAAENHRELSQRDLESRRMRKEDKDTDYLGKGYDSILASITGGKSFVSDQQSTLGDDPRSPPSLISDDAAHHHHRSHKKKKHRSKDVLPPELEVHVISENEDEPATKPLSPLVAAGDPSQSADDTEEDKEKMQTSDASDSDSSESSSDSDSDSDSSDSESNDDDEESSNKKDTLSVVTNGEDKGRKSKSKHGNKSDDDGTPSDSSTPGREGRFDDSSPRRDELGGGVLSDVSPASGELARSASKSPVPLKDVLPSYYPAIMGCRSVDEFECLNRIAEGTYGVVYRAREKCNNTIVALKRLKMEKEKEGFPITSLREINTLLKGQHCNIVTVREIVVGSNMDKIYIVMDYVEHDLKSLMETMNKKKQSFSLGEVKTLMLQLLRAVHHLHDNWILHRDLKTSNLLLSHTGILKVGDFGLAREYGSPLKQYTPIVVTLWYRAPELLLGTKLYSTAIDVWSVGCIFGELLAMEPMFPGRSEIDQLNRIFKELGTPSESIWTGYSQLPVVKRTQFTEYPYNHLRETFKERLSDKGFLLMNKFLTYDPAKRLSCQEALSHSYFHTEPPGPVPPQMFPTWPAKSEHPAGTANVATEDPAHKQPPKPPSGGKNFKDLGDDDGVAGFFLGGGQQAGAGFTLKF